MWEALCVCLCVFIWMLCTCTYLHTHSLPPPPPTPPLAHFTHTCTSTDTCTYIILTSWRKKPTAMQSDKLLHGPHMSVTAHTMPSSHATSLQQSHSIRCTADVTPMHIKWMLLQPNGPSTHREIIVLVHSNKPTQYYPSNQNNGPIKPKSHIPSQSFNSVC